MAVAKDTERDVQENILVRTFRETRSELRQVVWPSREETIRLTMLVIAVSIVIGLLLFIGDTIFTFLYTSLVSLVQ
ncbi:MAG: protein translocase subunit SecE [Chloroflexus sp.]|jgi:preprotein translocase subunit SecE|uniref:Protein translocase subunit SecE n=1 Tax=Chloroflexus aurantiacus (strain ATCC 29366 / DSM 635 / J-10-fl) TaxID=324602 RepID=A9WFP4_CHLAA|nr:MULTISPECIES: preprotein translocase subunit SecE [Chloroflexus]RMG45942.1 MAG: preprotein translocase subunit SecE [Chloroflexota bacterium]ABY35394.1 preprotein translocase, SecE subunit [Chloroflexus aurantiacus J-10-fl]GIV86483.1 MAG: protein translocase subunit SecE [Chloroflexus sp.]GIV92177.1 MAG: protein translocase subunit SecE [Chloroflexus sp.]HBW67483.1 preprotein translocase subunit SecE [Chloroflexus aurantiacus]